MMAAASESRVTNGVQVLPQGFANYISPSVNLTEPLVYNIGAKPTIQHLRIR